MLKQFYHLQSIEAGLDEVGRGCLAGPVVAAAVILPKDYMNPLLNDSKQLSRLERQKLRVEIEREALSWKIAEASTEEIDRINIAKASFLAMHRAVEQLTVQPEHLLVDGNRFVPYPMIPHTCIVKGDSLFASIAAASILAKTYRDELMEQLALDYPMYGWEQNVGYPTPKHCKALLEYGTTPWHRKTFGPVKNVLKSDELTSQKSTDLVDLSTGYS
ncbi:ribonuclease HII [Siphonobacter sp. BAB-5385]|uniref:ribonuclease HII n=1 Tax=unclassified Siphonobacter TaxID=2635712 RepID=UPI000B9DDD41|nr:MULTISPECIES: ribonuclease HII [unclassified Siphonobacter]OZI08609.1 ribonuclease HII [Siphonobacter sp. BAB-5385]PMD97089.1 ribonuclease HII [Siphonobacter sp. BAB-5405]